MYNDTKHVYIFVSQTPSPVCMCNRKTCLHKQLYAKWYLVTSRIWNPLISRQFFTTPAVEALAFVLIMSTVPNKFANVETR